MQCMAGAMTAGAAATGVRGVLVARTGAWLTPRRKVWMTRALIAAGVLAAGLVGPSGV